MVKHTSRDQLWHAALSTTHINGSALTSEQLADHVDVSERTARDCLKTMVDHGYLREHETPDGDIRYLSATDISLSAE